MNASRNIRTTPLSRNNCYWCITKTHSRDHSHYRPSVSLRNPRYSTPCGAPKKAVRPSRNYGCNSLALGKTRRNLELDFEQESKLLERELANNEAWVGPQVFRTVIKTYSHIHPVIVDDFEPTFEELYGSKEGSSDVEEEEEDEDEDNDECEYEDVDGSYDEDEDEDIEVFMLR